MIMIHALTRTICTLKNEVKINRNKGEEEVCKGIDFEDGNDLLVESKIELRKYDKITKINEIEG